MSALVLNETYINLDKGYSFGESGWQEPWTADLGRLYRDMIKEYGRCSGHVFFDTTGGEVVPVGWVFVKRMEYEDAHCIRDRAERTYLREVWVTIGEQDEEGKVWCYDVKRRKGTMPQEAAP